MTTGFTRYPQVIEKSRGTACRAPTWRPLFCHRECREGSFLVSDFSSGKQRDSSLAYGTPQNDNDGRVVATQRISARRSAVLISSAVAIDRLVVG